MAEPILSVRHLMKRFGAVAACNNLSLDVEANTVHGLIGPNGAGKTTAITQLSGELMPDSGKILFRGRDITRLPVQERARLGIARSYQITSIFPAFTVADNVALAIQAREPHSFRFWRSARTDPILRRPALEMLDRVGLADRADIRAAGLAHGEQRQLELAMALATEPAVLLLDEPMAGMGQEESARMVDILRPLKGSMTILLVEHDMDVVFALADRVTVLVLGCPIATGTPEMIRADADVRLAYLGEDA